MPFLEKVIEKYSSECINEDNQPINNDKCEKMLKYMREKFLPKLGDEKNQENKKWLVWDLNPRVRIHQNLSLTP